MPLSDTDALARRVRADLHAIRFPDRHWVRPSTHDSGAPVHDVLIVGAGHCGLTVAFALLRRGITDIVVLERGAPGRQGPWRTYGRMRTLRSPKHFNGPDLDIPSLTCEAWYKARHGEWSWDELDKIPRQDWQDYLLWFTETVGIPVRYETTVDAVTPDGDVLVVDTSAGVRHAREVVFATGVEGTGAWTVPAVVADSLPRDRYSLVPEPVDTRDLRGVRLGVLGGGASAYDNAATALESGADSVHLFFRRSELHRVNPHKWTEFAGFLDHFRDLPDEWRWRFMAHILPLNEPPPPDTFRRATRHSNFHLHLGETWTGLATPRGEGTAIAVDTDRASYTFDHLFVAVGLTQAVELQHEMRAHERLIARWEDVYTPPPAEKNAALARAPYLGPHFEYVEREPGTAPFLRHIRNFTAAATVSHGPSGSSINGMKQAAQRIATGICRDLFVSDVEAHYRDLLDFAVPELDEPWPPEH